MSKYKITWEDAISYKTLAVMPNAISIFETIGIIVKETDDYIIVKNPISINKQTGKPHPEFERPMFYYIPQKAIVKKVKCHSGCCGIN